MCDAPPQTSATNAREDLASELRAGRTALGLTGAAEPVSPKLDWFGPPRMSPRSSRWILWLCTLLTVPVPFWAFEGGRVPTAWLLELAVFTGALLLSEGGTVTAIAFSLFLGEAILAGAVFFFLARFVTRRLSRPASGVRTGVFAAIIAALLALSALDVYRTPFVAQGAPVNLVGIFE